MGSVHEAPALFWDDIYIRYSPYLHKTKFIQKNISYKPMNIQNKTQQIIQKNMKSKTIQASSPAPSPHWTAWSKDFPAAPAPSAPALLVPSRRRAAERKPPAPAASHPLRPARGGKALKGVIFVSTEGFNSSISRTRHD